VRGKINFYNETTVKDQDCFIDSVFNSELIVTSVTFSNINSERSHISLMESNATISNWSVTDFTLNGSNSQAFLSATTSSIATMSNLNFTDWSSSFINFLQSYLAVDSLILNNVDSDYYIIKFDQG